MKTFNLSRIDISEIKADLHCVWALCSTCKECYGKYALEVYLVVYFAIDSHVKKKIIVYVAYSIRNIFGIKGKKTG